METFETMESKLRKRYADALQPINVGIESGFNAAMQPLQTLKETGQITGDIVKNVAEASKEGLASYGEYLKENPAAETIPISLNELGKGLISGLGGIFGDTESLVRGIISVAKTKEGASKLESFIKGLEQETTLTSSEDVERRVEKVTGKTPKGAETPEVIGNIISPIGAIGKSAKIGAKAAKSILKKVK